MNDNSIIYPHMALTRDAAQQFGIPASYLRRLCKEGKVRFVKISVNKWLINCDSVAEYFQRGESPAEEELDTVAGIRRAAP